MCRVSSFFSLFYENVFFLSRLCFSRIARLRTHTHNAKKRYKPSAVVRLFEFEFIGHRTTITYKEMLDEHLSSGKGRLTFETSSSTLARWALHALQLYTLPSR